MPAPRCPGCADHTRHLQRGIHAEVSAREPIIAVYRCVYVPVFASAFSASAFAPGSRPLLSWVIKHRMDPSVLASYAYFVCVVYVRCLRLGAPMRGPLVAPTVWDSMPGVGPTASYRSVSLGS